MNTTRIQTAANRIAENERALTWLREFGAKVDGRNGHAKAVVEIRMGGSCTGAKEAAATLSAYATLSLPDLVQTAIKSCENTIIMDRDAIRAELDAP